MHGLDQIDRLLGDVDILFVKKEHFLSSEHRGKLDACIGEDDHASFGCLIHGCPKICFGGFDPPGILPQPAEHLDALHHQWCTGQSIDGDPDAEGDGRIRRQTFLNVLGSAFHDEGQCRSQGGITLKGDSNGGVVRQRLGTIPDRAFALDRQAPGFLRGEAPGDSIRCGGGQLQFTIGIEGCAARDGDEHREHDDLYERNTSRASA